MPRFERIRDHLPSLYRPDDGETSSLLVRLLQAVAKSLDTIDREAGEVMQSHWYGYADQALYSPFFLRGFQLQKNPLPKPDDPELQQFPYILDLARLAALLPLLPQRDPAVMRELVEVYRLRIRRFVSLYTDGLTTLNAIRRIVEATLPVDLSAPAGQVDLPFWIEEFAPVIDTLLLAPTRGEPANRLGPLMRWSVTNESLSPSAPILYVQAADTATRPLIELYESNGELIRLGIGYDDVLTPGQTLRIRPSFSSWLRRETGLEQSAPSSTDPTSPGPWSPMPAAPTGTVAAIFQSQDLALWVAVNDGTGGKLFRFDGQTWTLILDGLAAVRCLMTVDASTLLVGTDNGLLRLPLFEEGGFIAQPIATLSGRIIFALLRTNDQALWAATDEGLLQLGLDLSPTPTLIAGTPVHALHEDVTGNLYIGGSLGLFQRQAGSGHFYWYSGEGATEQQADWVRLDQLPSPEHVFLPAVTAIHRGADSSLWIGTESGVCRYLARSSEGLAFETVLEAFPDLGSMQIFSICKDERGLDWFCSSRGVFRFDGRDWWQFQNANWTQLGRADTLYSSPRTPRGSWRFDRTTTQWQRFDLKKREWIGFTGEVQSTEESAVLGIYWTDGVEAELGAWDGNLFSNPVPVDALRIVVRFKPDDQRVLSGGIPAIPKLPANDSMWRYLSMEAADFTPPTVRPFWTTEGRLLPPPQLPAPSEGRYSIPMPPPSNDFEEAIFAYPPEARVWMHWRPSSLLSLIVRLQRRQSSEQFDPAITDRVWQGIQQVRPAGVRVLLAVGEEIVKGK